MSMIAPQMSARMLIGMPHRPRLNQAFWCGQPRQRATSEAEVAQEVAQVDQPGRRDRQRDAADRPDQQDRDGGEDADRDRGVGRGAEAGADVAPRPAAGQVPVPAHREHHPGRGALDRQRADEDRRQDDEEVDLADRDAADDLGVEVRRDGRRDRELAGQAGGHRGRDVLERQDDRRAGRRPPPRRR